MDIDEKINYIKSKVMLLNSIKNNLRQINKSSDEKKLKEALYTDKYNEIEPFIDVEVEAIKKPSSIRINKRKVHVPAIALKSA